MSEQVWRDDDGTLVDCQGQVQPCTTDSDCDDGFWCRSNPNCSSPPVSFVELSKELFAPTSLGSFQCRFEQVPNTLHWNCMATDLCGSSACRSFAKEPLAKVLGSRGFTNGVIYVGSLFALLTMRCRTCRECASRVLGATSSQTITKLVHQMPNVRRAITVLRPWMDVCQRIATATISAALGAALVSDSASAFSEIAIHQSQICVHKAEIALTMKLWCVVLTASSTRTNALPSARVSR